MRKIIKFLRYIINESIDSMIRKVFAVLKADSRNGDFVDLVNQHIKANDIDLTETDIKTTVEKNMSTSKLRNCITFLISENKEKSKTKHIEFDIFEISPYLSQNRNTYLSITIFTVRSGTLDIKVCNEWNYEKQAWCAVFCVRRKF